MITTHMAIQLSRTYYKSGQSEDLRKVELDELDPNILDHVDNAVTAVASTLGGLFELGLAQKQPAQNENNVCRTIRVHRQIGGSVPRDRGNATPGSMYAKPPPEDFDWVRYYDELRLTTGPSTT